MLRSRPPWQVLLGGGCSCSPCLGVLMSQTWALLSRRVCLCGVLIVSAPILPCRRVGHVYRHRLCGVCAPLAQVGALSGGSSTLLNLYS